MASDRSPAILSLPPELLVHALAQATPQACAAFASTNSLAHDSVNCTALWRALHRKSYDDPHFGDAASTPPDPPTYDWATQVQRRTRAQTLLDAFAEHARPFQPEDLVPTLETLVDLARTRPPVPPSLASADAVSEDESDSLNERWLERWLTPSSSSGEPLLALHPTFSRSSLPTLRSSSRPHPSSSSSSSSSSGPRSPAGLIRAARIAQLAAHLHVLATPCPLALASPSIRTAARETVYEMSNFGRESLFGPFMNDGSGRVDWRKVEALAIVCGTNLDEAMSIVWGGALDDDDDGADGADGADGDEAETVVPPRGWRTTRAHSAGPVRADPAGRDWAGVTHPAGWRGTYSFLHYPVFHHFNRHRHPHPHAPQPTLAHEHEAVGDCMVLRLELLPEGEWPPEIDQPDLSLEALGREDGEDDEEGDGDWVGGEGESGASSSEDGEDDEDEMRYFAMTCGGAGAGAAAEANDLSAGEVTPPTSPPDDEGDDDASRSKEDVVAEGHDGAPALSPAALAALAGPHGLGPLPAAPHTAASAAYPAPSLTFRPSSPAPAPAPPPAATPASSTQYPPLAFRGTSLPRLSFRGSFTNAGPPAPRLSSPSDRSIRGTVSVTPEGHTRWQYVIRYGGGDQWAMNGVQLGGPGSAAGVVGVWSSAERAEEGPCGPFWYWPHRSSIAKLD
ncbi:hypothetical protein DMC30DRAFT_444876 [Rhodotorula diobovata]|uniref:F-box domain-containing protein n=1 Tax=Rhodotorula diobovata TaxID=5288 RepID=A0A5C5G157_9BASI|nr:hypothetical protein DMC30DRAFT_444876 [Rhodotorula diobovata]